MRINFSSSGAHYFCENCFGPLEVAYDHSGLDPAEAKRRIQAGSQGIWRYADFLPFAGRPGDPLDPGLTPLLRADRLADALGVERTVDQERRRQLPHTVLQGSRGVGRIIEGAEFGMRTVGCATTGNLANSVAALAASAGLDTFILVPADLERTKIYGTAVYGAKVIGVTGTYDEVNRLCSQIADKYKWGMVNVNLRAFYAEGSKSFGFEIAEDLGWRLPQRVICPIPSAALFTKIGRGFQEWLDSAWSRAASRLQRRPGPGLQPGRDRLRRRVGRLQAAEAGDDRQEPGDRRPGRRPLRGRAGTGDRRPGRRRRRRRDPRRDRPARRDHRDLHRDGGRRHGRRPAQARRAGRNRRRRARRHLPDRRGAEDPRRRPR